MGENDRALASVSNGSYPREYPPRPIVGIGVAVLRPGAVLLVQRGRPPNLGAWSLPGGAQEVGETAEEAARRELLEETGVTAGPLQLAANVDSIARDETGRVRFHYTIIDFAAAWDSRRAARRLGCRAPWLGRRWTDWRNSPCGARRSA